MVVEWLEAALGTSRIESSCSASADRVPVGGDVLRVSQVVAEVLQLILVHAPNSTRPSPSPRQLGVYFSLRPCS